MSMLDKIIIMLTHNDKTVPNAIEIFEENKDLPSSIGDSRTLEWNLKNESALHKDERSRQDFFSGSGVIQ